MKKPYYLLIFLTIIANNLSAQKGNILINYTVSIINPEHHTFQMELELKDFAKDTIQLKIPNWTPGYYQFKDYASTIENISAERKDGTAIVVEKINKNTWQVIKKVQDAVSIKYSIKAEKQFVADSFMDTTHAYIVPANNFLYPEGYLNNEVQININRGDPIKWQNIATGLTLVNSKTSIYRAKNFDFLYDCPILIGNLDELPSFKVKGVPHKFIGYKLGDFDGAGLMNRLQKIIEAAVDIFDDIPYNQYTFIGIGPGRGGIEHLNTTTVSFDGNQLTSEESINRTLNFLAHEYFHHYNAKRIRPFELGPFDYENGSKTNQLWIAEGLTVYYEYIISKKSGIIDKQIFFNDLESHINAVESNPGRKHQSLAQASFNTWKDGPFGNLKDEKGKTISYYDKGPIVGLFLDFAIRNATHNEKSLNDVMKTLYWKYYKELNRGFTEAEFQTVCETIAGVSLAKEFEYVYTTKELDYNKYLNYAGLKIEKSSDANGKVSLYRIMEIKQPSALQKKIQGAWLQQ
ncbi:hypothetical protein [Galbibacter sp. PAP.153]|uniref:M61 family metallopeptidase n=1 Tax=Galbibacter sp. PAP.153 TaxID=3104623 RepID=UPI0030095F24